MDGSSRDAERAESRMSTLPLQPSAADQDQQCHNWRRLCFPKPRQASTILTVRGRANMTWQIRIRRRQNAPRYPPIAQGPSGSRASRRCRAGALLTDLAMASCHAARRTMGRLVDDMPCARRHLDKTPSSVTSRDGSPLPTWQRTARNAPSCHPASPSKWAEALALMHLHANQRARPSPSVLQIVVCCGATSPTGV